MSYIVWMSFPTNGTPASDLLERAKELRSGDLDWQSGSAFSLVYNVGDATHEQLLHDVVGEFLHDNALNPFAYPGLASMEADIVAMAADLLGGSPRAGALSSGGTESIFLAVQTARDFTRATKGLDSVQMITANTAHPAFAKAAKYLDVEHVRVPVGDDLRLDVDAVMAAVTSETALVVGSAPCYPYGVIDPIEDLAAAAKDRGLLCHVDACLGGWMLPFWEALGESVPAWNLSVDGVTSLSADIHKYGYSVKGASVILYSDRDLLRHQHFLYSDWPGGMYGSATTAGTRPAGPIAAAWAAISHLGHDGYVRLAGQVRDATRIIQEAIARIDGIEITGDPHMSVFEFGSESLDIFAVGDVMEERGWKLDRQDGGLHLMLSPAHLAVAERFVTDLRFAAEHHGESAENNTTYGGIV